MFIWIVVLKVSAFGYSGTIILDDPKHRKVFQTEAGCRAYVPEIRKGFSMPALASLDGVVCRKMEIKE